MPTPPKRRRESQGALQAEPERRRTKRLPLRFQIEVAGRDRETGVAFRERTVTLDVNEHDCQFSLLRQLHPADAVTILIREGEGSSLPGKPLPFDIVWARPSERGWTYGAENLQRENVWHVKFPHADDSEESEQPD